MKALRLGILSLFSLVTAALPATTSNFKGYSFDAYVLQGNGMRYREFNDTRGATLKVMPEEEYSIVVRNPLPVRAAVAVTIDGLNSIDGKRSSPRKARKWMIEPHSSITISGWQTGGDTLRKFLFTRQDNAYANWRESKENKPYTKNLGVIGVAWFWNNRELDMALHPPQPFEQDYRDQLNFKKSASAGGGSAAPSAARAEDRAGTGMGRQEQNHVTEVEFNADAGMFSVSDVLKLFYEFAKEPTGPMPFVEEGVENERFAPDMYK